MVGGAIRSIRRLRPGCRKGSGTHSSTFIECGTRCLLECLEGCNRAPQFGIDLRRFTTCWDRELSAEVKSFVADRKVRPEVFRGVLAFLSGQDRPAAVEVFERLRARRNATSTQLDDWDQALVVVGLLLPEVGWAWAWAWPKLSRCHLKKAQSILLALSNDFASTAQPFSQCFR
jgi:hypothetical protein